MNVDRILQALNDHQVCYLLVGGMNFLLRHQPVLTYDVDVWLEPDAENLGRAERALAALDAEWGSNDSTWGAVQEKPAGWLGSQSVYCLTSPHGAIDVFLSIKGVEDWAECRKRALEEKTAGGVPYAGLSDRDMLISQEALEESERKPDRIRDLKKALNKKRS